MKKTAIVLIAIIFASFLFTSCQKAKEPEGKKESPHLLWEKEFAEGILEFDLAENTGEVLINTGKYEKGKIMYFTPQGTLLWDKVDKNISFAGADVSESGEYVIYQATPLSGGKATDYFQSNIHFLNRKGEEIWKNPNPYGNKHAVLSPTGKYIVFGDAAYGGIYLYDNNLNLLFEKGEKEASNWFLRFDPTEKYIVEGMNGVIYNIKGEEVWEFVGSKELMSTSLNAEMTLTRSFFRDLKKEMYLNIKKDRLKIRVDNVETGALSTDGKYIAVAREDSIKLFNTDNLLDKSKLETVSGKLNIKRLKFGEVTPLWEHKIEGSKIVFISNDNKYILILTGKDEKTEKGTYQKLITKAYLLDISGKLIWEKEIKADQYKIKATSSLRNLVYQDGERKIKMLNLLGEE